MTYDNWKTRSDLDEYADLGPPPCEECGADDCPTDRHVSPAVQPGAVAAPRRAPSPPAGRRGTAESRTTAARFGAYLRAEFLPDKPRWGEFFAAVLVAVLLVLAAMIGGQP